MKPLRVGLIGAGWVTQHHLAGWRELAGQAKVVAIADPGTAAAQARAAEFGIASVYDGAEKMLAEVELDAVDIAAPREFHAPLVRLAAQRGLQILCQKPLAPTLAEAEALVRTVGERVRLMVHENWRFRPYYRDIREAVADGRIGNIVQAQMTLWSSGLVPDEQGALPALVRQPFVAMLDRALVMEILIHHIDTLRYLVGDLSLVHARLGRQSEAMRGEDRAFLAFESEQGASVSLMANLGVHGRPPALVDQLTLIGTKGTIELHGGTLRGIASERWELTYDMAAAYQKSYSATIAHFVQCLQSGRPFETSAADNLKTLSLVEQAYQGV